MVYITSGACVEDLEIAAVESGGEIIFSRFRHDYRMTVDGQAMIDGGRDYTRGSTAGTWLTLKFDGPELVIVPTSL
jgi:hypothetical protein